MRLSTPAATVAAFVDAMNRGDLEGALGHYEADAILIVEPGAIARGLGAIREALGGMLALRPRLETQRQTEILGGDLALYHSTWTMVGTAPDGATVEVAGQSSDVLRRGADGEWRIALDNPWGSAVLGEG